jgi:excisionase family DNA binding protein
MPNVNSELDELRERVARLEQAQRRPRGRTNLPGAARYLGISDETLRQRIARGQGPRGTRNGRFWSFTYDDLDAHAEQSAAA